MIESPMDDFELYHNDGYLAFNEICRLYHIDKNSCRNFIEINDFSTVTVYHSKAHRTVELYDATAVKSIELFSKLSKAEKSRVICNYRYGTDNFSKTSEGKKHSSEVALRNPEERLKKATETIIEKYGSHNFYESSMKTIIEKYGSAEEYYTMLRTKQKKTLDDDFRNFCITNDCVSYSDEFHPNHAHSKVYLDNVLKNLSISLLFYKNRFFIKNNDCKRLHDYIDSMCTKHISSYEDDIASFLDSINVQYERNVRNILDDGREIDFYIPSKKVALEFDGLYYHSELFLPSTYHLEKTLACEKLGIRLIHIFEDEWISRNSIIKSVIASSLGIYEEKIFARKCVFKEIPLKEYNDFLENNHLHGKTVSKYRYGLYHNDNLVMVMGFGKPRFSKDNAMELIRFCTKINFHIIGGFSRLFKNSLKILKSSITISYIDRRAFNGQGYIKSGFSVIKHNLPNYAYCKNQSRFNKRLFRKSSLSKKLKNYDPLISEHKNMLDNGYYRIYDCGTVKVEYREIKASL